MRPLVAIPVKNRLDLTKPLVENLLKDDDCNVLVYDNGSDDGTTEWLESEGIGHVLAHSMALHEMWNDAIDKAIHVSGFVPLVILNNDLELDGQPRWITRLCEPFAGKEWDALCPNYDQSPNLSWRPIIRLNHKGICAGRMDWTGGLAGFAFALSPDFLKTGYRFPTDLKWWFGDNDLVLTLEEQGRMYGMVAGCGVTHIGGGSQTAKDHAETLDPIVKADRAVFEKKWRHRL